MSGKADASRQPEEHILDDLTWRGLIAQSTDAEALYRDLGTGSPVTVYAGFDPTAPSLHMGNMVPLLTLARFQRHGHRPIVLAGGATGLIGDPSGRTSERTLNSDEVVQEWAERIRGQLERFVEFDDSPTGAIAVNNLEWTGQLGAIDFLRTVGKHFSVNQMLAKESVSARLEGEGLSFTEFSYALLQANDYLELYRRFDCTLQIGGSDQWGNIVGGLDLIRKAGGSQRRAAHALTMPLITDSAGRKFGKSTGGGTFWLDPELTSPYAFYQYWITVDDRDVIIYLRFFTFLSKEEIAELEHAVAERPAAREAQKTLAREVTVLIHGEKEFARVEAASAALFGRAELHALDPSTLQAALAEAPSAPLGAELPTVVDALVATGLSESRSAARRAIAEGGAYVNNVKVADPDAVIEAVDLLFDRFVVLRRGKRSVAGLTR